MEEGRDGAAERSSDTHHGPSAESGDALPTSPLQQAKAKIDILLKPAGDAPIMKKKRWFVEKTKKISAVCEFIKKYIKSDPLDSMFLYVNQSFAPAPDTELGILYDCFGSDGKLVLHYCKTQAWG